MVVQLGLASAADASLHDAARSGHGGFLGVRFQRCRNVRGVGAGGNLQMNVFAILVDVVVVHAVFSVLRDKEGAGSRDNRKKDKRVKTHLEEQGGLKR